MGVLFRRMPSWAKVTSALVALWTMAWFVGHGYAMRWLFKLMIEAEWVRRSASAGSMTWDAFNGSRSILSFAVFLLALGASVSVGLGLLARMVARARLRAGYADPLDAVRAFVAARPKVIPRLVAASWLAIPTWFIARTVLRWGGRWMYGELAGSAGVQVLHAQFAGLMAVCWCVCGVLAVGVARGARPALGVLLEPTLIKDPLAGAAVDERLRFDAVAVTAETRAAVALMAVLPAAVVFALGRLRLGGSGDAAVLGAYVATAVAGIVGFMRASRIAVGIDGVRVTGSSRTQLFAYRTLDAARVARGDLELSSRGKVVLRLQLHGKDAAVRDELLARIQRSIREAHEQSGASAASLVAQATEAELARAAAGASDYRAPAVTREQLWGVVTGAEHGTEERTGAAKALAATGGQEDRARLRVAADRCADPKLRVELRELAEDDADDEVGASRRWAQPRAVH